MRACVARFPTRTLVLMVLALFAFAFMFWRTRQLAPVRSAPAIQVIPVTPVVAGDAGTLQK